MSEPKEKEITFTRIQEAVARHFNVTVDDLTGPRRPAGIAWARQFAMYVCRQVNQSPYQTIAKAFGNRDHATVIHACRKVHQLAGADDKTKGELKTILSSLQSD